MRGREKGNSKREVEPLTFNYYLLAIGQSKAKGPSPSMHVLVHPCCVRYLAVDARELALARLLAGMRKRWDSFTF